MKRKPGRPSKHEALRLKLLAVVVRSGLPKHEAFGVLCAVHAELEFAFKLGLAEEWKKVQEEWKKP